MKNIFRKEEECICCKEEKETCEPCDCEDYEKEEEIIRKKGKR